MTRQNVLHFQILSELGRGGMGVVYLARDTRLQRTVALKFLRRRPGAATLRPLVEEAIAASRLRVDSVVTIHADYEPPEGHFLCMEYLPQGSLVGRIARGPLGVEEILRIGIDVARALEAAHDAGILHCDLKPGNILLAEGGTAAKLTDFGLSRWIEFEEAEAHASGGGAGSSSPVPPVGFSAGPDSETRVSSERTTKPLERRGRVGGTVGYMSPEQFAGESLDRRADLYSLGIVLFEMATGRNPWHEASAQGRSVSSRVRSGRRLRGDLPPAFWKLVESLTAEARGQRPQDATSVLRVLMRLRAAASEEKASRKSVDSRPLEGRKPELSRLGESLEQLLDGCGAAVLIEGQEGSGKTALVERLRAESRAQGATVLRGSAPAQETSRPFGPFVEAVAGYVATHGGDADAESFLRNEVRVPGEVAACLAALVSRPAPQLTGRYHPRDAFRSFVQALARDRSVVLVLEDLHNADIASAELFSSWAPASAEIPLLLVGTFDPQQAGPPSGVPASIGATRRALLAGGVTDALTLGPLDRPATERLLRSLLPDLPAGHGGFDQVFWRSGGLPGFVVEIARLAQRSGSSIQSIERVLEGSIPDSTRESMARRVERLGSRELTLLRAAALAGERFELALLATAGLGPKTALEKRLRRFEDESRLIRGEGEGRYRFELPQLREFLAESTPPEMRRELHGRFADALSNAAGEALPEVLAHHLIQAGRAREAGRYLREAANSALSVFAEGEALRLAHLAERNLPRGRAGDTQRRDISMIRGRALESLGRYQEALLHAEEAVRLARRGASVGALGEALALLGFVQYRLGDTGRAERTLREAESRCGAGRNARGVARVVLRRGNIRFREGKLRAARTFYRKGLDAARRSRDRALVARARANLANVHAATGQLEPAAEAYREALQFHRRLGDQRTAAQVQGNLGLMALRQGRIDEARSIVGDSLRTRDQLGDRRGVAAMELLLARCQLTLGDWKGAAEHARRAREVAGRVGHSLIEGRAALIDAECRLAGGALSRAERALSLISETAGSLGENIEVGALELTSRIRLARGDLNAASTAARKASRLAQGLGNVAEQIKADRALARVRLGQRRVTDALGLLDVSTRKTAYRVTRRAAEDIDSEIETALLRAVAAKRVRPASPATERLVEREASRAERLIARVLDDLGTSADRRRYATRWRKQRRQLERLAEAAR